MKDVEIIGILKTYVKATLVGMGALKGAPCQCVITTNADGTHTVTMKWEDDTGTEHTDSFTVLNGQVGSMSDIADVQLTSLADGQVLAWDSTANKWVNVTNSATVASLENIGDVQFSTLADGQVLTWDETAGKWKNGTIPVDDALSNSSENPVQNKVIYLALADKANSADLATVATTGDYSDLLNPPTLGTAAAKDATSSVTENSTDVLTSGGAYTALANKADKGTSLSDYGITNAYTKTETDSAISTEIEKLDVSDSATAGSYVTAVSETDGKVSVTREVADDTPTASSNKMVKSGGVYTEDMNEAKTRGALGAKNLLPNLVASDTYNSGTVTKNADGSLTIDGTFDAVTTLNLDYVDAVTNAIFDLSDLIGVPMVASLIDTAVTGITLQVGYFVSGGTRTGLETVSTSSDVTFPSGAVKSATYLRIADGTYSDVTVYPMIRYATDIDPTYKPFAKSNKQLTDEQGYFTDDQWAQVTALLT